MKAPQFTQSLAKALANIDVPITYKLLTYKGEEQGVFPVLGPSAMGHPTGLERFPIFDEEYRPILVGKFLDTYLNYEIAHESADMFWNALRRWLNQNMPYYNELYKTIDFETAMTTVNLKSTSKAKTAADLKSTSKAQTKGLVNAKGTSEADNKTTGKSKSSSGTENLGKAFDNQYPMSEIQEDESYGTGATLTSGKSDTKGDGETEGTELAKNKDESESKDSREDESESESKDSREDESESNTTGFQGNTSAMLAAFRANIVNTDRLVVTDMRPLFMLIHKNTDTVSTKEYMRGLL